GRAAPYGIALVGAAQHFAHQRRVPATRHEFLACHGRRGRRLDDGDELVDIRERHRQTFQHVTPFARLAQLEHGTTGDHFAPVRQEVVDHLLEIEQTRLAVDQRHQIDAEGILKLRVLEKVVEHDLGHFAALELDHEPHAVFVGLVANIGNALDAFLVDEFGDFFLQRLLVDLIRQRVDHDGLTVAAVDVFKVRFGAHDHAPAPGAVAFTHPRHAVNNAAGREIGRRDDLHEIIDAAFRVTQYIQAAVDHLGQVVGRNIGGHAHRNTRAAVHQQVGQA